MKQGLNQTIHFLHCNAREEDDLVGFLIMTHGTDDTTNTHGRNDPTDGGGDREASPLG